MGTKPSRLDQEVLDKYIEEWIANGGVKWKAYHASHPGCSEAAAKSNCSKFHKDHQDKITASIRQQVGNMGWMVPHTLEEILKFGKDTAKIKALEMLLSLGLGIDKTTKIEMTNKAATELEEQQLEEEIKKYLAGKEK